MFLSYVRYRSQINGTEREQFSITLGFLAIRFVPSLRAPLMYNLTLKDMLILLKLVCSAMFW
jgi:hypothetical protein